MSKFLFTSQTNQIDCFLVQSPLHVSSGFPCLPGWKHSGDLSSLIGSGAAPDGDVDAIVGMIIFVKVMEANGIPPGWSEQVSDAKDWADKSCTQFLVDNTVLSSSGNHRLLKLGSCWGGWDTNGNNPSYHAPGHYKMMRDFQASISSRGYPRPDSLGGDNRSWDEKWNMLIDTSYKFLNTAQCPSSQPGSGLVPNWALVTEVDANTLDGTAGSFSGSGTPQYEFGAEASRTMWRVAFDALAYPEEAEDEALSFLEPLYGKLSSGFNPNHSSGLSFAFAESSVRYVHANSLLDSQKSTAPLFFPTNSHHVFLLPLIFSYFSSRHAHRPFPMSSLVGYGMGSCMALSSQPSSRMTIKT